MKSRVEQLEDLEESNMQEMLDLSQEEYVKKITELNEELTKAWDGEQRVKALKIVIQVVV